MTYDPISDLAAVTDALAVELRATPRNECAIAACALFVAVCTRPAVEMQSLKDRGMRDEV